jgi:ABC-type lipoprotein export system ATPase subunit
MLRELSQVSFLFLYTERNDVLLNLHETAQNGKSLLVILHHPFLEDGYDRSVVIQDFELTL